MCVCVCLSDARAHACHDCAAVCRSWGPVPDTALSVPCWRFTLCFVVCPAGPVHKHAATSFVLVSFSLDSGCAAFGRQPLCNRSPPSVTDVPCLCVCVCVAPPFCRPRPVRFLFLPSSCRQQPDLGHWGQRTGCGPQWVSTE